MQARVLRANLIRQLRTEKLLSATDHVLVAVSGGYDSLHLLHWLTDGGLPADVQPKVSAVYVNHHLRLDAAEEEALVRREFERLTPSLATQTITEINWDTKPTTGIENQARERRYALLDEVAQKVGANKIVTAHHQGDQVETVLYKLARGSQLGQLTGMQSSQAFGEGLEIVRPLLSVKKAELPALLQTPLTEWIEDYTNDDIDFARNRLRQVVRPALTAINQKADEHVVEFAGQLSALLSLAEPQIMELTVALEEGRIDWHLPTATLLLVLQNWLHQHNVYDIKDAQLQQAIKLMNNRGTNRGEVNLGVQGKLVRAGRQLVYVQAGRFS